MIERLPKPKAWNIPASEGTPPLLSKERVVLDCGCAAYVGLRMDRSPPEEAMVTKACSEDHLEKMSDFIKRYIKSLEEPQDRPAVEVAEELLTA